MRISKFLRRVLSPAATPTSSAGTTAALSGTAPSDAAASLAAVLFSQQRWQLRKVESRLLQAGSYSVTRVSIDCIPQALPGLRYAVDHEPPGDRRDTLVLVPITMMRKGTLRSFDMRDGAGNAMPVIGRSEYRELMVETLMYEAGDAALADCDTHALADALADIVDDDAEEASDVAVKLVVDGTYRDRPCLNAAELSAYAAQLILSLADSYVLIALLPDYQAGHRQVIKYEHHSVGMLERPPANGKHSALTRWVDAVKDRSGSAGPVTRFRLAAGLDTMDVTFDLSHPAGSASHHLEVHIPEGVRCERLSMPVPRTHSDRNTTDTAPTGVAHGVAVFVKNPDDGAVAEFRVPWEGLRQNTALVCLVTSVILLLGLLLPGAQAALLAASDGAAALLLAVPAVAFAFAIGGREHEMITWVLRPLRMIIIGCVLLLLACAGSIVGVLHDWARFPLWWTGAVTTMVTGLALAWTAIRVVVGRLGNHGDRERNNEGNG